MSDETGSDADGNQTGDGVTASDPSDRYERIEELGSGGLGTVYRATQHRLGRDVAIKEVRNIFEVFADLDREGIVDRFAEVTEAQASIAHPNIARVFDLEVDEEYPYAVSEFADEGTLRSFIDDEGRSLQAALKYFLQVLGALNTAHNHDLIHGGIKPENVLVDDAGNAVVTDFGHSGVVDVSEGSNQVYVGVGTVNYMPPEQFDDPTAATEASDLYSAGIMFYEMLTGKVPGRRSPMPSSFHDDIPTAIDDIFDRMTMDRVEDRYETIDAVLEAIYQSTPILQLLDRRSAVAFQRNPLREDATVAERVALGDVDEADTDDTSGAAAESSTADTDDSTAANQQSSQTDDDQSPDDEPSVQAGEPDDSNGADDLNDASDADASEDLADDDDNSDEDNVGTEPDTDADRGDQDDSEDDAGSQESEGSLDEASDEDDAEEDEVLDKLEDYGELFDED
jgi:serine/threonine protein kinase